MKQVLIIESAEEMVNLVSGRQTLHMLGEGINFSADDKLIIDGTTLHLSCEDGRIELSKDVGLQDVIEELAKRCGLKVRVMNLAELVLK